MKTTQRPLSSGYVFPTGNKAVPSLQTRQASAQKLAKILIVEAQGAMIAVTDGPFGNARDLAAALQDLGLRLERTGRDAFRAFARLGPAAMVPVRIR